MLTDNDLQLMMLFIQSNEGAKRKKRGGFGPPFSYVMLEWVDVPVQGRFRTHL
jgi:hypothetical protein